MKLEHFWHTLTNGDGYVFKRSNKVLSMITPKNLEFLQALKPRNVFQTNWLPTEQVVTISDVKRATDSLKRQGTTNHTVLIPIKQYLLINQTNEIYKSMSMSEVPESNVLEPLEVET